MIDLNGAPYTKSPCIVHWKVNIMVGANQTIRLDTMPKLQIKPHREEAIKEEVMEIIAKEVVMEVKVNTEVQEVNMGAKEDMLGSIALHFCKQDHLSPDCPLKDRTNMTFCTTCVVGYHYLEYFSIMLEMIMTKNNVNLF